MTKHKKRSNLRLVFFISASALASCDVQPLSRGQLVGSADAASDAAEPEVPADAPPDGPAPDAACIATSDNGLLSGLVVDLCSGQALEANVGVAGRHMCSFRDKGSFHFNGLPTGCRLTLTARKEGGYRPWAQEIVVAPDGTANVRIALERDTMSGCTGPAPAPVPCRCDLPGCS